MASTPTTKTPAAPAKPPTPPGPNATAAEITAYGNAIVAAAATANMAISDIQKCPKPTWKDLPNLSREIPALLFAPACLPGTETANGCPAAQAFYTIALSYGTFLAQSQKDADGNQFWAATIPANLADPRVVALLKLMVLFSKSHFINTFSQAPPINLRTGQIQTSVDPRTGQPISVDPRIGSSLPKGVDLRQMTMGDVLKQYPEFVPTYGNVKIQVQPDPNETTTAFIARGGYLLWIGPNSAFNGGVVLDRYSTKWLLDKGDVRLRGNYVPDKNLMVYSIVVVPWGTWQSFVSSTVGLVTDSVNSLCQAMNSSDGKKAALAATAAAMAFPAIAPYLAAYKVAATMCGISFDSPPCIPQVPQPGEVVPLLPPSVRGVTIQTPKGGTIWATGLFAQEAASTQALGPKQAPTWAVPGELPPPTIAPSPYPDGTIAWFDASANGYRIATPLPGVGTTHVGTPIVLPSLPPVGIQVVTETVWQKAVLPWSQRITSRIGMIVGAMALGGLAFGFLSRN